VLRVNTLAGRPAAVEATELYRVIEMIDGREVVKYTDQKPR
jgi:hypothetical protein